MFFFYYLFNVDLQYLQYKKLSNSNINQIHILIQIDGLCNKNTLLFQKAFRLYKTNQQLTNQAKAT